MVGGDDDYCRVWVGNLSNKVDKELLYELFLQAGPLNDVVLPKDSYGRPNSYAFVTFKHPCSVLYSVDLFDRTELFGKELKIRPKKQMPRQNNELHSVNSLRGFSGDLGMKGRDDLSEPCGINSPYLMPRESANASCSKEEFFPNLPDFNMLLQMGQQLLQNPYSSMMGSTFAFNSQMYPSQGIDSVNCKQREDSSHNYQNDHRPPSRHDRDFERPHPYHNKRPDDRRHGRFKKQPDDRRHGHFNNSRNHHSSNYHRRERK